MYSLNCLQWKKVICKCQQTKCWESFSVSCAKASSLDPGTTSRTPSETSALTFWSLIGSCMPTSHISQISSFPSDSQHQTAGNQSNKMAFDRQLLLANHLDGGGEGHADLLRAIGEEAGSCGLDLPGSWGGLGVEVSRLTCQSHKRDIKSTCQSNIGSNSARNCCQSDVTGQTGASWARRLCSAASRTAGHRSEDHTLKATVGYCSNLTSANLNNNYTHNFVMMVKTYHNLLCWWFELF